MLEDDAFAESIGCLLVQEEPERERCFEVAKAMLPEVEASAFDVAWGELARSVERSVAGNAQLERLARRARTGRQEAHERTIEGTLGAINDKLGVLVDATVPASGDPEPAPASTDSSPEPRLSADSGQVFLSYRHIAPDEGLAEALDRHLRELGLPVFLDKQIEVGMRWVEEIDRQIRASSFFVPILSKDSIRSDMVRQEIALAHRLEVEGKLRILPIRSADLEGRQLPYDLGVYLDPSNSRFGFPGRSSRSAGRSRRRFGDRCCRSWRRGRRSTSPRSARTTRERRFRRLTRAW